MTTEVSITLQAWILMVIPVILILIFYTILRNKSIEKTNIESDEETSINWIKKKDLLYWLIIICLGAISVFSFKYRKADEMIDHWGFAGTIVSIILAVLAIIYTYYQSATTVDSTKRLEKSAKKVQRATTKVEEATKELENSNIDSLVTSLESRITELINNVQVGIGDKLSDHQNEIKGMFETRWPQKALFDNSLIKLTKAQWEGYVSENVSENTYIEGIVLIHIFYKHKFNLKYNINQITNWLVEFSDIDREERKEYYFAISGILSVYRSLGIFDYDDSNEKLVVNYFPKELSEAMEERIKEIGLEKKVSIKKIIEEYK